MSNQEPDFHILFVDDEIEILEALKRQMSLSKTYKCYFVSNPLEVYEVLHEHKIDIIVADVVMPEMDGITLLQDIKIKYPKIVRILLTAYGDYNTSLRAINEAEVYGFLTKPWEDEYLFGHLKMASQMISNQLHDTIDHETPLLVIATWHDSGDIKTLIHTGEDELLAHHFTKRVFMTSAALFGFKYRFQGNRFTLPLVESNIMVRGALEHEGGQNFGLFVFIHDIDEEVREDLDHVLDMMFDLLPSSVTENDLQNLKQSHIKFLSRS